LLYQKDGNKRLIINEENLLIEYSELEEGYRYYGSSGTLLPNSINLVD
jgi:hypothetical protein